MRKKKLLCIVTVLSWSLVLDMASAQVSVGPPAPTYIVLSDTSLSIATDGVTTQSVDSTLQVNQRQFVDAGNYANFDAALTAASAGGWNLRVTGSEDVTANATVPETIMLEVRSGGSITVSTGKILTINGPFFAGNWTCFYGNIDSVRFGSRSATAINARWFGAVGDSTITTNAVAIKAALAARTSVGRRTVFLTPGTYIVDDTIRVPSNTYLFGMDASIASKDTNKSILLAGPLAENIKISGLTFRYVYANKARQPNTSAIYFREVDSLEISNCHIFGSPGMGMQLIACRNVQIHNNIVERTLADGIHVTNGNNLDTGRNIRSENVTIIGNQVHDTGDDHIAVVSYQRPVPAQDTLSTGLNWTGSQQQIRYVTIIGNVVTGALSKYRTRGISILGARDVTITGNVIKGADAVGDTNQTTVIVGILVQGGTFPFRFHRPVRIVVANNTIYGSKADHSGAAFELINGAMKFQGCDSVIASNNIIDWTPFMSGIMVYGDTILSQYGWDSTPRDVVIENNIINNARLGVHLLQIQYPDTSTRWIQRVTIKNNRFSNMQRDGVVVTRAKTVLIEGNEFFGLNKSDDVSVQGINLNVFAGNTVVRNNKFFSTATTDSVTNLVNVTTPVTAGSHTAHLYLSEDNVYAHSVRNQNVVINKNIVTTGLFEYGSVDYLADTISVSTAYVDLDTAQNRPRSTITVSWNADSSGTLTITNAGTYRIAGHIVAASADSDVTLIIGISQNNAAITDNYLRVDGYLGDSSQFHTIPFNFFVTLAAGTSIKPKIKVGASTHDIYIRRGSLTLERLN